MTFSRRRWWVFGIILTLVVDFMFFGFSLAFFIPVRGTALFMAVCFSGTYRAPDIDRWRFDQGVLFAAMPPK